MASVDQTMMKVQRLLTGPMGLRVQLQGDSIGVSFQDMSTHVRIKIIEWGKNKDGEPRSVVRIWAPVLRGLQPSPGLYEYLLREARNLWFGSFEVWDDEALPGTLYLTLGHTLLGDYLDEDELASAMYGVLHGADDLDDKIKERFGGKRWVDS